MNDNLELYFNQSVWDDFIATCKKYHKKPIPQELSELIRDKEIELAIEVSMVGNSVEWVNSEIPALNNLRPIDCLEDETLLNRLKVCLLRMPY